MGTFPTCFFIKIIKWSHHSRAQLTLITVVLLLEILSFFPLLASANFLPEFIPKEDTIILIFKEGKNYTAGTVVHTFRGSDRDGDRLTFSLAGESNVKEQFRLSRLSRTESNLILKRDLDRERFSEYIVEIMLTDKRSERVAEQSVLILVADANDNSPVFTPFNTSISIPENSPVPRLLQVLEAKDADEEGPNSEVSFALRLEEHEDHKFFNLTETAHGHGALYLIKPFDYETKSKYSIRIIAYDNPLRENPKETEIILNINVENVDENLLHFNRLPLNHTQIGEDIPNGSTVFQVEANHGASQIRYELLTEKDKFAIDEHSGILRTNMWFNRDYLHSFIGTYELRIKASEFEPKAAKLRKSKLIKSSLASVEATVFVRIVDVDESPKFRNQSYRGMVPENSPVGYPISLDRGLLPEVFDADFGGTQLIKLKIEGSNDKMIAVQPSHGYGRFLFQFLVKDPERFDHERLKEFTFHLVAEDDTGHNVTAVCSVRVADVNDNTPFFSLNSYFARMPENPPAGLELITINATDVDAGNYGTVGIRYTKLIGWFSEEMELNDKTGRIKVRNSANTSRFDREVQSMIYIVVEVRDNLGKGNGNHTTVTIELVDKNDNRPQFTQPHYQVEVEENLENVSFPLTILALDSDQDQTNNSKVGYSFYLERDLQQSWIDSDPSTNLLFLKKSFDFEDLAEAYPRHFQRNHSKSNSILKLPINFTIEAYDFGVPRQTSHANLTVFLVDQNDCAPKFSQTYYEAKLPGNLRNEMEIIQVHALDVDVSPKFKKIEYKLVGTNVPDGFKLDSSTGVVTYVPRDTIHNRLKALLEISAVDDESGLESEVNCLVNITMADINSRAPYFLFPNNNFDDDDEAVYGLIIGNRNYYSSKISENSPPGTVILTVEAYDPDPTARIRYSVSNNGTKAFKNGNPIEEKIHWSKYISVCESSGVVETGTVPLDFELLDRLWIIVEVNDLASETGPQSALAPLLVRVMNANDERPKFSQHAYHASIKENSKNGTVLLRVTAVGEGGQQGSLRYSFFNQDETFPFTVDPKDGTISVAGNIDRETSSWINFTVAVNDSSANSLKLFATSNISVRIEDDNDNPPIFTDSVKEIRVKENTPVGTTIAQVKALDYDEGLHGRINYFLRNESQHEGLFQIDSDNGAISIRGLIDRELQDRYELSLEAVDNLGNLDYQISHTVGKTIVIHVEDENDESPQIHLFPPTHSFVKLEGSQRYTIPEDLENSTVLFLSIYDDDQRNSPNSEVTVNFTQFHSDGSSASAFQLIKYGEHLWTLERNLLSSSDTGNFTLRIEAEDSGQPKQSSYQTIYINIKGWSNNEPPKISQAKYTGAISPGSQPGMPVLHLASEPRVKKTLPKFSITLPISFHVKNHAVDEMSLARMIGSAPFIIDPVGGLLRLNFSVSDDDYLLQGGYFQFNVTLSHNKGEGEEVEVAASSVPVQIHVVQNSQRLRLQTGLSKMEADEQANGFYSELQHILGLDVVLDVDVDGNIGKDDGPTFFRLAIFSFGQILQVGEVDKLFTRIAPELAPLFSKYRILGNTPLLKRIIASSLSSEKQGGGGGGSDHHHPINSETLYLYYALALYVTIFALSSLYVVCRCCSSVCICTEEETDDGGGIRSDLHLTNIQYNEIIVGSGDQRLIRRPADVGKKIYMNLRPDLRDGGVEESEC